MLRIGPAAAIADPKNQQRMVGNLPLGIFIGDLAQRMGSRRAVVSLLREHVRQNRSPIDSPPVKSMVGKAVHDVPRELLRHEKAVAAFFENLRQLPVVSKDIRLPAIAGNFSKLFPEKSRPVENLAHERLPAGDTAIRLHPECPLQFNAPGLNRLLDARIKHRVIFFHPGKKLGLARAENITRIIFYIIKGVCESPRSFADRLADRPEPGQVQVGMPHGRHFHAPPFCPAEKRPQAFAGSRHRFLSIAAQRSRHFRKSGEKLVALGAPRVDAGEVIRKHFHIVIEGADIAAADAKFGKLDPPLPGNTSEEIIESGIGPNLENPVAHGAFWHTPDGLAGRAQLAVKNGFFAGEPPERVPRVIHNEEFPIDIDAGHQFSFKSLGQRGAEPEPGAIKEALSPAHSGFQMQLLPAHALGKRDRLGRAPCRDFEMGNRLVNMEANLLD